jgi:hypothetical protein
MSLTPRLSFDDRIGRVQLDQVIKVLRLFALAADRIESALGKEALDSRPVRRGALLTLADLRRARELVAGLKRMEAASHASSR